MSPLPENAKKVFEGTFFDVYNREQRLYDGTTKTFEKVLRLPSTGCWPIKGDKILIAHQEQPHKPTPYYGHLGGVLERNEEPVDGIKRELLEESGMIAESYELYKYYEFVGVLEWSKYFYIARGVRKIQEQQLDPGSERITVVELSFDEYVDLVCTGEISERGVREEIMLMKIQGTLGQFKKLLFEG